MVFHPSWGIVASVYNATFGSLKSVEHPRWRHHLSQRISTLLSRASNRKKDSSVVRRIGRRLVHLPGVLSKRAVAGVLICKVDCAVSCATRSSRRSYPRSDRLAGAASDWTWRAMETGRARRSVVGAFGPARADHRIAVHCALRHNTPVATLAEPRPSTESIHVIRGLEFRFARRLARISLVC